MVILQLLFAVLLDYKIGDPQGWPHPIIYIGKWIKFLEKSLRKLKLSGYVGGFILWSLSVAGVISVLTLLLKVTEIIHPWLNYGLVIYLLFASLAATCLKKEVMMVADKLENATLEEARTQVSYLVGRDTQTLTEEEVLLATIETTAENTIDGVLAPLLFIVVGMMIGYPVQMVFLYKTINTLDSMVGYIQEPYRKMGYVSAKIDDLANYIPARLGSLIMLLAGGVLGYDISAGRKILRRDRRHHKSPNAGYPESVVAGLLNIQLGGTHTYFGEILSKPTIGDDLRKASISDIIASYKIMYMAEFILMFMMITLLYMMKVG